MAAGTAKSSMGLHYLSLIWPSLCWLWCMLACTWFIWSCHCHNIVFVFQFWRRRRWWRVRLWTW